MRNIMILAALATLSVVACAFAIDPAVALAITSGDHAQIAAAMLVGASPAVRSRPTMPRLASSPRALCGGLRAQGGVSGVVAEVNAAVQAMKDDHRRELDNVQLAFDELNARITGGFTASGDTRPLDPEYSNLFASWARKGDGEPDLKAANQSGNRAAVQAAMSAGSDSAGGYLAPIEWDRRVNKALEVISPMRRLARVVPTTVRGYSTLWSKDGWASGWVGETAARPNTNTPSLDPLTFDHGEIYANPAITQQLLDDADFDVSAWLSAELADEFNKQEGVAFIGGNGVNKPRGLLTYVEGGTSDGHHPGGNLTVVPTGAAAALPDADGLIDFVYGLTAPYRQNARWLMNSLTAASIAKMKDGDENYLWRETYVQGQPATLLGYPVEIDENMPSVTAGALPIAFGNFQQGYVINDRMGVRVLRDPYTNKPYVNFYTTKRVGGGLDDPNAIRLLRVATAE